MAAVRYGELQSPRLQLRHWLGRRQRQSSRVEVSVKRLLMVVTASPWARAAVGRRTSLVL